MKNKLYDILCAVFFCTLIGTVSVLYFVLPKKEFSELEKRYLAETPVVNAENVFSGGFGKEAEAYMADYMPGRDFFVGVNAYFDRLTFRQISKDIYVCEGNRLVEKPVEFNMQSIEKNTAAVNEFVKNTDCPVDFMLIPSAGWAAQSTVKGIADPYCDRDITEAVYKRIHGASVCEVLSVFDNSPELFYRTDHHWNSMGAFKAYCSYAESLGKSPVPLEDFTVEKAGGFRGTTFQRSAFWLTPAEEIEMWTASDALMVSTEKLKGHSGAFFREHLQEADMYTVFLDGNQPLVSIENPKADCNETLIVIRDSYSNCLGSFLAQSFSRVILADLRYYRGSIGTLCEENDADRVLICYSLSNFMSDKNLFKLNL